MLLTFGKQGMVYIGVSVNLGKQMEKVHTHLQQRFEKMISSAALAINK